MKKKLLILCDYFLPGYKAGGPVRSLASIIENLKSDFDITVATRDHDLVTSDAYSNILSDQINSKFDCQILYLSEKNILRGLFQFLKNKRYDIVYFNTFFSPKFSVFPLLLIRLHLLKARKIILSPRGELGAGALSIKHTRKKLFVRFYRLFFPFHKIIWHATSEDEKKSIQKVFGKKTVVTTLANIPSVQKIKTIQNNKKTNNLHIVFLSRISKKKNLLFALEVLSLVTGAVQFDIVGPIHDCEYWRTCLEKIKTLPANITVTYCGDLPYEQVSHTLRQYDLFFLPTRNENYGHVIVEALAAGCPALLSDQTPWQDLSDYQAGWAFPLIQSEKFSAQIDALITMNTSDYLPCKQGALDYYTNRIQDARLVDAYQTFFEKTVTY